MRLLLLAMVWFASHRRITVTSSSCVRREVWSPDWEWTGRRSVQSKVDLQKHDCGSEKADRKTWKWRGRTLCVCWSVICDPFTTSDFSLGRLLNWNCYAIGTSYASMELWYKNLITGWLQVFCNHAQLLALLPDSTLCAVMEVFGTSKKKQISYGFMHVEYAENGSLFAFLQRRPVIIERQQKWAMEIAQGK